MIEYQYSYDHTIFIKEINGVYKYYLYGHNKESGYMTSFMGSFPSEYEAFCAAADTISGPYEYWFGDKYER